MSNEAKCCSHCGFDVFPGVPQYNCGNPKCPWPYSLTKKADIFAGLLTRFVAMADDIWIHETVDTDDFKKLAEEARTALLKGGSDEPRS